MPDSPERLIPARPNAEDDDQAYMRRIPWVWIVVVVLIVAGSVYFFRVKEEKKALELRSKIVAIHQTKLDDVSKKYLALRNKLEDWILHASRTRADSFVNPNLRIEDLHKRKGIYLRLRFNNALSRKTIAEGAATVRADAIAQCLGIEPFWARELYQLGEFLLPEWLDEARVLSDVMRLRVIDDELTRRIQRDLPRLRDNMDPEWFLLVLQHGKTRHDEPVDVFLWNVSNGESLLRTRIKSKGTLVPLRFGSKDAPPPSKAPSAEMQRSAADDCSIAAEIKALAIKPAEKTEDSPTEDNQADPTGSSSS